ncbi:MAG: sugar ABC transporter permease [Clostridia bacterium]|nr:sugar ABC transporter permease [Clostridia bacterium]
MKIKTKNALTGYALVLPLLLGFVIFYAVPFCMVVWYSVTKGSGRMQSFVFLENYFELFDNELFVLAMKNTALFLLVGLSSILVISYAIALFLKSCPRISKLLRSLILMPYVMPIVGTVLIVDILFSEAGLGNVILTSLGLPIRDWLNSDSAFWVMVMLYIWKNTGYSVVLILSGLATISDEQYAAASLDGANGFQKFRFITMPQMWYSVFFAGIFSLINAFKSFREIFLLGGTHPHESIYMLQHFINNCFEKLSYSKMAVTSVLMALGVCVLFLVCYLSVMRKEEYKE